MRYQLRSSCSDNGRGKECYVKVGFQMGFSFTERNRTKGFGVSNDSLLHPVSSLSAIPTMIYSSLSIASAENLAR